MEIQNLYITFLNSNGVSTDTRTLKKGEIFFALNGPKFNGNDFAKIAIEKGAAFVVIDKLVSIEMGPQIIEVKNTLLSLQELANYHRKRLKTKIIAITGSNGKTTTRELIREVISKKYNVLANEGNYNNHIGVPLTLLKLKKKHEIAIIEMGANHLKEIEFLCNIALPDWGYITNFGKAHLEGFGSEKGVIQGKSELYKHLEANKGQILINGDDPVQVKQTDQKKVVQFGSNNTNDYKINPITKKEDLQLQFQGKIFKSSLYGNYNFTNIAASIAFGIIFKVPLTDIQIAVEGYQSENNRSQKLVIKGVKYILDAYNANPSSMEVAINAFANDKSDSKIVILGDMLELGKKSKKEHESILELCLKNKFSIIFTIGENFKGTSIESKKISKFENLEKFKKYLMMKKINYNSALIKGSRSMKLERLISFFKIK